MGIQNSRSSPNRKTTKNRASHRSSEFKRLSVFEFYGPDFAKVFNLDFYVNSILTFFWLIQVVS